MKQIVLFIYLSLHIPKLLSQEGVLIKRYTVEDGLTSNHLYTAFQDSKGYLWLGTTNGVSRFDGKQFTNFTSNNGLPDNDVFEINEDPVGRIWLSCYNDEPCYIKNNVVYTSDKDSLLRNIRKNSYLQLCRFGEKLLISQVGGNCYEVGTNGGIKKLALRGARFLAFGNHLMSVSPSRANHGYSYYLFDRDYKKADSVFFKSIAGHAERTPVRSVYALGKSRLMVVLKNDSCFTYVIRDGQLQPEKSFYYPMQKNKVYSHQGNIWYGQFGRGLIPLAENFEPDTTRKILFKEMAVQNFMVDREGNYWACTSGDGLLMIPNNNFLYYTESNGLTTSDIHKLALYHDEVYLGMDNSINTYNRGKIQGWKIHNSVPDKNRVLGLYSDYRYVVAGRYGGLVIINKIENTIRLFNHENLKCMTQDTAPSVWFGTHSACYQFSIGAHCLIDSIKSGRTFAMLRLNDQSLLVATLQGLVKYSKTADGRWRHEKIGPPGLLDHLRISCIKRMDSIIVIGTVQKGLILLCGNEYEFVKLEQGGMGINCRNIFIGKNKTIWLASYSGVFSVRLGNSIHTYTTQAVTKFNGLLSNDVNDMVVRQNTLFVAGSKGLSVVAADKLVEKTISGPFVYIHDVVVSGKSLQYDEDRLTLTRDSGNVEFHFSAIDFRSLGNILFKYRMKGITNTWQYVSTNFIRFESLPPGDYCFEVSAMNSQGAWSATPASFYLRVKASWWMSPWLIALEALMGIGLVYFLIRRSLYKKHRKQMRDSFLKRHITELELRAIKAQINPHFIFNTLNAIQYFIANNQNELAGDYLERMAKLLRKTLDFSNRTSITVEEEIAYLENYLALEKLRFDDRVAFTIHNRLPHLKTAIELPPMILQPHVENALRHGLKNKGSELKELEISFSLINHELVCEVSDNGVGRKAVLENKTMKKIKQVSMGMQLSHDKLLIHEQLTGKKIKTEVIDKYDPVTSVAAGTLIKITISQ